MPEPVSGRHLIAGREIAEVSGMSYRRHLYILRLTVAAKLETGQSVLNAVDPERAPALLAGFLVPVVSGQPAKWTEAGARELAQWIGDLEDAAAHETLDEMLVGLLAGFFVASGNSGASSRTSSEPVPAADPLTSEAPSPIAGAAI